MHTTRLLTCLCFALLAATSAAAQGRPYRLHEFNFDMWCQQKQHLPPDRCDKRLPRDDADFEAYVNKIEKYEIPYLQHRRDEERFNRSIMHYDPIGNPTQPSVPQNQ
jgi:hypothetical protein